MYITVGAHYARFGTLDIVGACGADVEGDTTDKEICEAVFSLLNGAEAATFLQRRVSDIALRYRLEKFRSMSVGDVISISTPRSTSSYAVEDYGYRNRAEV